MPNPSELDRAADAPEDVVSLMRRMAGPPHTSHPRSVLMPRFDLNRAADELERLRAALLPFAALADSYSDSRYWRPPDRCPIRPDPSVSREPTLATVGDCRRAREALHGR